MTTPFFGRSRTISETERPSSSSIRQKDKNIFQKIFKTEKHSEHDKEIVEIINIEEDLKNFKQSRLSNFKPELLYKQNLWDKKTCLIQKIEEKMIKSDDNSSINLDLINRETIRSMKDRKYIYTHLGLIIIG